MAKAKYWSCRKCAARVERIKQVCPTCGSKRPAPRVPKHAVTLQKDDYKAYEAFSMLVHGGDADSCRVCGRPRHESMNHHRDHDHVTGQPRGVVCFQCNSLMPRLLTLDRARLITAYLERVQAFYAEQERDAA